MAKPDMKPMFHIILCSFSHQMFSFKMKVRAEIRGPDSPKREIKTGQEKVKASIIY